MRCTTTVADDAPRLAATLLYGLAVAASAPRALSWDALSFLGQARAPGAPDYGHALYVGLLGVMERLCSGLLGGPERAASTLSVLGAAVTFFLLWGRVERAGATKPGAAVAAAFFAATPLFWHEAGSIEPSSWTIAFLLLAADAAEAYGRVRTGKRMLALAACFTAAMGFHVVSICALPWLVRLAAGPAPRPPLRHLAIPVAIAAWVTALAWHDARFEIFWIYWRGFVPRYADGAVGIVGEHLTRAVTLAREGLPVLLVMGVASALWLRSHRPRARAAAATLALPYGLAFLVFGKPLVGLLLPVALALGLLLAEAAGTIGDLGRSATATPTTRRVLTAYLSLALAAQLGLTLHEARAWRTAPDLDRDRAARLVRSLPESSMIFAGPLAAHIRYAHPDVRLVALPELLHHASGRRWRVDPVVVVHRRARRLCRHLRGCYLSSEGLAYLETVWNVDRTRLALDTTRRRVVPDDPALTLVPIDAPRRRRRAGS
jgi:hypothetical protein